MMHKILDTTNFDALFFIGDTHGNNIRIFDNIPEPNGLPRVAVHVGDFGVGFKHYKQELSYLTALDTELFWNETMLYVIRGNHDDPAYFKMMYPAIEELTNIQFVQDHTMLTLVVQGEKKNIYLNGGAISIDRMRRITGNSYWSDEKFICPNDEELDEIVDVDIVVTHTRPEGCWPYAYNGLVMHYILGDGNLDFDLQKEQKEMLRMFDAIKKNNKKDLVHYYGHMHNSYKESIDNITHICLDICEVQMYDEKSI